MASLINPASCSPSEVDTALFGAERVTHLYPNDCYYAHLSIYRFASHFLQDGNVLDAGSGAGYGSAYLANHGARFVSGIDFSSEAVAFSQEHFQRPNLSFRQMNLEKISGFEKATFDLIFTSNVLEHVSNVAPFFYTASQLLKPGGVVIIAVPPVINWLLQADNISNPFHLNIWSPRQWHHVMNQYFANIQCYQHMWDKTDVVLNFAGTPEQSVVTEQDFVFTPITLDEMFYKPTLTAIFLARNPRSADGIPCIDSNVTYIDDSFTVPLEEPSVRKGAAYALLHKVELIQKLLTPLIEPQIIDTTQQNRISDLIDSITTKDDEIAQLENALIAKNEHIIYLENLIKRIQDGRVMQLLGMLKGRPSKV